ncbi:MAG: co-chaperone DjlA [Gammaproteobacteria bacterium]
MSWWGKVVGGAFGFMLGGPLGGVFGAAVGHHFDRGLERSALGQADFSGDDDRERIQAAFFTATFAVMGYLAKADGRVTPEEIKHAQAVMREMALDSAQREVAQALFREGKSHGFDLDGVLDQLVRECHRRQTLLQMFVEIQLHAAYADGALHRQEETVLRHIAGRLGFSPARFAQLEALVRAARGQRRQRAQPDSQTLSIDAARAILGVGPRATPQEVKNAYRRLMNQHHPDKLIARGMPEEMVEVATARTQEIRKAYDIVREATPA